MASSLTQLRYSTFSLTSRLTSTLSILPPRPPVIGFWTKPIGKSRLLAHIPRQVFCVRALTYDAGLGPEEEGSGVAVVEEEKTEVEKLKKALVDSFYGTDRGLEASSDTRAEIVELINQLEAFNPTPAPTDALTLLNGKWILAYTSFAGLLSLLSKATGSLIRLAEISHTVDSENFAIQKSVQFAGPWTTTSISANAKYEVRSPKRLQIKIEEGVIGSPQLTDSLVIPEEVEILGQKIDLTPFKGILTSVQDTASSVARTISSQPPLKIPISSRHAELWLLTTYLDEEIRIIRGDGGSFFVLIKEGSSLLIS